MGGSCMIRSILPQGWGGGGSRRSDLDTCMIAFSESYSMYEKYRHEIQIVKSVYDLPDGDTTHRTVSACFKVHLCKV